MKHKRYNYTSPKYQLRYKDCYISKSKQGSWRREQSSPDILSMDFSQTAIFLPWPKALCINCLPAIGLHILLLSSWTISIPKLFHSPSQPSPTILFCFLQPKSALTLNSPFSCLMSLQWPHQDPKHHSQLAISSCSKWTPLWTHQASPTVDNPPSPSSSFLVFALLPFSTCFTPLPTTLLRYCICLPVPFVPQTETLMVDQIWDATCQHKQEKTKYYLNKLISKFKNVGGIVCPVDVLFFKSGGPYCG